MKMVETLAALAGLLIGLLWGFWFGYRTGYKTAWKEIVEKAINTVAGKAINAGMRNGEEK